MIQENINQILSNIGVITALGDKPGLQAMSDKKKFITAKQSLQDITENMEKVSRGEKSAYTDEELKDIEERRRSDIKDVYDVKTKELGGGVYGSIVGEESAGFKHSDIADLNERFRKARESLKSKAEAKITQDEELKEIRKQILKGTPSEFSAGMKPKNKIGGIDGTK